MENEADGLPAYDPYWTAAANYFTLRVYLERHDSELAAHLIAERERLAPPFTSKKAKALFSHFTREAERKVGAPQTYTYRPLELARITRQRTVEPLEETAERLAVAQSRLRLMQTLHEQDQEELAALITQVRDAGLVGASGAAGEDAMDAILRKATTQCDALRDENRRLKLQLEERKNLASEAYFQLVAEELEAKNVRLETEAAQLRAKLEESAVYSAECELTKSINEALCSSAVDEHRCTRELIDAQTSLIETRLELAGREATIETMERTAIELTRQVGECRATTAQCGIKDQLVAAQEAVIERMDMDLLAQQLQIEAQNRDLVHLRDQAKHSVFTEEEREALRAELRDYREELDEAIAAEMEYTELVEERNRALQQEVDTLYGAPVWEMQADGTLRETAVTLQLFTRPYYVVDADSVHAMNTKAVVVAPRSGAGGQDGLWAWARVVAASHETGEYRAHLLFSDPRGALVRELWADNLAPQRMQGGGGGDSALLVDFSRREQLQDVRLGALPRDWIPSSGTLRVRLYVKDRQLGEREEAYAVEGARVGQPVVVPLGGEERGAQLLLTGSSPSLLRLDFLVVPLPMNSTAQ